MGHTLAVIGGSGLYDLEGLTQVESLEVSTPFGPPSSALVRARLKNTTLLFLPRHGKGHTIGPSAINYRANICALKMQGATHLVSVSAVGSMKESIAPGDAVVVDQFIDLTRKRASTFFDEGLAAHVAFSHPVCPLLATALQAAVRAAGGRVHSGGTYVCIEGPQFSTKAESLLYRSWGVSVIGMTNMPEAKLAREAELPFATLAMATDYDCWHDTEEPVTLEQVVARVGANAKLARGAIAALAVALPDPTASPAYRALAGALISSPSAVSEATRQRLGWLVGNYLNR